MSIRLIGQVWHTAVDLDGSHLLILLALADWSNDEGECWPKSMNKLAEKARVSRRTVWGILKALSDLGYIQGVSGKEDGTINRYTLTLDRGAANAEERKEERLKQKKAKRPRAEKAPKSEGVQYLRTPSEQIEVAVPEITHEGTQNLHTLPETPTTDIEGTQNLHRGYEASFTGGVQLSGTNAGTSVFNPSFNGRFDDSNHPAREKKKQTGSTPLSAPPSSARSPSNGAGSPGLSGAPSAPLRKSHYLNAIMTDYSNELNDGAHAVSNVSQATRLWNESGLAETEFSGLLHEAKSRTREYQGKSGARGIRNKMAYFFEVLRGLVRERELEGAIPNGS